LELLAHKLAGSIPVDAAILERPIRINGWMTDGRQFAACDLV
jgi:hypothetical protein